MFRALFAPIVCVVLSGCAFNSVFFPLDNRPQDEIPASTEIISIVGKENGELYQLFRFAPQSAIKAEIMLFQGSGSTVNNWYKFAKPLVEDGYQVYMMEYFGFGANQGSPNHEKAQADAFYIADYLIKNRKRKDLPLILMGQSYGGQLAMSVGAKHQSNFAALVLEGTYTSFEDEASWSVPSIIRPLVRLIFVEPYRAEDFAKTIQIPTLIVHSSGDRRVPIEMGQQLYSVIPAKKEFWQVTGSHLATLLDQPENFVSKLNGFLSKKAEIH